MQNRQIAQKLIDDGLYIIPYYLTLKEIMMLI